MPYFNYVLSNSQAAPLKNSSGKTTLRFTLNAFQNGEKYFDHSRYLFAAATLEEKYRALPPRKIKTTNPFTKLFWRNFWVPVQIAPKLNILLNVNSVAKRLGIKNSQVRKWDREGTVLYNLYNKATSLQESSLSNAIDSQAALHKPPSKRKSQLYARVHFREKNSENQTVIILPGGKTFTHFKDPSKRYESGAFKKKKTAIDSADSRKVARLVTKLTDQSVEKIADKRQGHANSNKLLRELRDVPGIVEQYVDLESQNHKGELEIISYMRDYRLGSLWGYRQKNVLSDLHKTQISHRILQALHGAHERRIYHRDLKPENVLIDFGSHSSLESCLCDFDNSWIEGENLNEICGTIGYMSPEKIRRWLFREQMTEADSKTDDVWGMGMTLYFLWFDDLRPQGIPDDDHYSDKVTYQVDVLKSAESGALAPFQEPSGHPMKHLIWEMLQFDSSHRISISEVLDRFEKIYSII